MPHTFSLRKLAYHIKDNSLDSQKYLDVFSNRIEHALQLVKNFHLETGCGIDDARYSWVDDTIWVEAERDDITEDGLFIPHINIRNGEYRKNFLTFIEVENMPILLKKARDIYLMKTSTFEKLEEAV